MGGCDLNPESMWRGRQSYALAIAAVVLGAAWALGFAFPSDLIGAGAWSVAVLGVLFGLGSGAGRLARVELNLGETLVLGAAAWIALTGPLLALGVCSRGPMIALAAAGTVLAVLAIGKIRVEWPRDRSALILGAALGVFLAITLLGMVVTHGNPYDDRVAYTPFVKRLLEAGNLVEPFSLRRLSAYGGQTCLLALAALRGDVESTDLLDRGIFQVVAVIAVIGLARRRQLHLAAIAIVVVFVLGVWDMSINSAGTWTGFACFTAAYAFATRDDVPRRTGLGLAFCACAAACTIRQNYLVPAGLFAALLLVFHLRSEAARASWRKAWQSERRTVWVCVAIAAAIVVPYMIAAWRSNHTFLYPLLLGTGNPAAPLRPTAGTFTDELAFFLSVAFGPEPIRIWWLLAPFMVLAKDPHALKPWRAYLVACVIGMVFLVHSFLLSDPTTLWRYAFGYMTPLAVIFLIEIGARLPLVPESPAARLRLGPAPTLLVWLAVACQFVVSHTTISERMESAIQNLKAAVALGTNKNTDADIYRDLQATVPEGARLAVMLDDPCLLDFARNDIISLDLVGFAAPPPGLPSFLGPERWRSYFGSLGIRYIAFVDADRSEFLYRRHAWLYRMYSEGELWRFMGAHMVDAADTLDALSHTSRVLFDRDGVVVLDLGTAPPVPATTDAPEQLRQDQFLRRISETELHSNAWQLSSRQDVVFEPDGVGPGGLHVEPNTPAVPTIVPAGHSAWDRIVAALADAPAEPAPAYRWIADRTHVRVHGTKRQHVHIKARMYAQQLSTMANQLVVTLDGSIVGRASADRDGYMTVDGDVACHGWCDLYLGIASVPEYWRLPDDLQGIKLLELQWDEQR